MDKAEFKDLELTSDAAGADCQKPRRRRLGIYRWPVIFLGLIICLFILSNFVPFSSHESSESHSEEEDKSFSTIDQAVQSIRGNISAAYLPAENLTSPAVLDAVLHPDRKSLSSPNNQWRITLQDNADLVLEHSQSGKWSPVWWSNTATYKQRNATDDELYLTLGANGSLRITTMSHNADGTTNVTQRYNTDNTRLCAFNPNKTISVTGLVSEVVPQSLMLDDSGRLVIWNASGEARCVLSDYPNSVQPLTLNGTVDMEHWIPPIEVDKDHWPEYTDSRLYKNLQLRSMLESDLARNNRTLGLNATQLETIYNLSLIHI